MMNKTVKNLAGAVLLASTMAAVAQATTITAIFGSGNPDNGWSSNETYPPTGGNINGVQLALRAKTFRGAVLPNSGFDYYATTGYSPLSNVPNTRSMWNLEFSINSDLDGAANGLNNLTYYTYRLSLDTNPGVGITNTYVFDPVTFYVDNSLGNNSTANGAGVETNNPGSFNIAQNSQNSLWIGVPNVNIPGIYTYTLEAFSPLGIPDPYARTQIRVTVAGVPDGGATVMLMGLGLAAIGVFVRRNQRSIVR